MKKTLFGMFVAVVLVATGNQSRADILTYGDMDLFGFGYSNSPTFGATLQGQPVFTRSAGLNNPHPHPFPFSPSGGDFPGTDQIYVGSVQTGFMDGYSVSPQRINGPQVLALDYSSIVPAGGTVTSFTLGIAADDFQQPSFGQPFIVLVNGVPNAYLTAELNSINQGGPVTEFYTWGLPTSLLDPNHTFTLSIDQGGNGGDGWAVDFLTVGVEAIVPLPPALALWGIVGVGLVVARRRMRSC